VGRRENERVLRRHIPRTLGIDTPVNIGVFLVGLSDRPKTKKAPRPKMSRELFYTMGNLQLVIGNWFSSFAPINCSIAASGVLVIGD